MERHMILYCKIIIKKIMGNIMMKANRILLTALTGVLLSASLCFAAHKESVHVVDADSNKAVVRTDNGAVYELRIGKGCPAIVHYQKKDVVIEFHDKFLGNGSKIILPKERQQCPINSFSRVKGPTSQKSEPRKHP